MSFIITMPVKSILLKISFLFCLILLSGKALLADQKPKNYDAIIFTNSEHRYKGLLLDVSDKGMIIDYLGQQKFFSADSISSIKIKRIGSRKKYALAAGGIGFLAGIPIYIDGNNKGKLSSLALPVVLVGTAVGGVLIGSLVNSVTAVQRFDNVNKEISFKSIQPVLLRYSRASPTRVPTQ
jgi:hypothetical protein